MTKMSFIFTFFSILTAISTNGQTKYEKDFNEFWNDINNNYAYLDQQQLDWNKAKEIYQPRVKLITNNNDFIKFLETVINEFHNGHISLNTNLNSSNRITPSGQDFFCRKKNNKFYITDIRKGFGADLSGLKIGDEIQLFNSISINQQIGQFLPKSTSVYTQEMLQYAYNMLFAGTHNIKREIAITRNGKTLKFYPESFPIKETESLVETKILNKSTAYIKINNSLGNLNTIGEFDKSVDKFIQYKNLIIDLTETPSGGNTTVARSMMGRFVNKDMPYQQHEFDEKEFETKRKWVEYVTPRKSEYKGKVYIIVGYWTGSMGEGIAVGFGGLKRAQVIGTKMAGLLGAINSFTMSETNIGFQIPTERLYHINGTPRENFRPDILTKNIEETLKVMNEIK